MTKGAFLNPGFLVKPGMTIGGMGTGMMKD
jgi:hypothetical protein